MIEPHPTKENYCCACDYDIAVMDSRVEEVKQALKDKIEEMLNEPMRTMNKDNPQYVLAWNVSKYTALKRVIALL